MAVRSKPLAFVSGSAADRSLYTCPTGETALVKRLTAVTTGGTAAFTWWIQLAGSGTKYYFHTEAGVAGGTGRDFETWVVLLPTDVLGCVSTGTGTQYFTAHGAELEGLAD